MSPERHRLTGFKAPPSLWVLVALFGLASLLVPQFFSLSNFENLLRVSSILGLASLGQALVILTAGVEFSIGSAAALCSIVVVFAAQSQPVPAAFGFGFLSVLGVGALNGMLVAFAGLPAFLATLGVLMLVHGFAAIAVGGLPIEAPVSYAFYWLARAAVWGVPVPILVAGLGFVLHYLLLSHSRLGRQIYLIGSNDRAARLAGIAVQRVRFLAYVIAAGFVAMAALILTARVGSGQPNLVPNLPFETISACAIGGISLAGGRGSTLQVAIGVLIISILNNAIVLLNLPTAVQLATLGLVILGAVTFQTDALQFRVRLAILLFPSRSKEKS